MDEQEAGLKNKTGITGLGLIGLIAGVCIVIVVCMVAYENLFSDIKHRIMGRVLLFAFMINMAMLLFLPLSFSKLTFEPGPPGPRGIRGREGPSGRPSAQGCRIQPQSLGKLKRLADKERREDMFEKPVLATD